MKKLIASGIVVAVAVALLLAWSAHVRKISRGVQGEPVRAVNAFMDTVKTISCLLWDEKERESTARDLKQWLKALEEGKKQDPPESLSKYRLEDPNRFFRNRRLAKGVMTALAIFHFESFSAEQARIQEDRATVNVEFLPTDVLGIGKAIARLGAPEQQKRNKPVRVVFTLEKHRHRWYIVEVGGELAEPIKAFSRLRGRR